MVMNGLKHPAPAVKVVYRGYVERDLVTNRSSLLLHGGTESDRRAWADEAAQGFEAEGPLLIAHDAAELRAAVTRPRGVVFIPDVSGLDDGAQSEIVRALREREERPKYIIVALPDPDRAVQMGKLRGDLAYSLKQARLNLDEAGLKDAIRIRRARASKRPTRSTAKAKSSPVAKRPRAATPAKAAKAKRPVARPKAARRAAPVAAKKKKKPARPAVKKSRR